MRRFLLVVCLCTSFTLAEPREDSQGIAMDLTLTVRTRGEEGATRPRTFACALPAEDGLRIEIRTLVDEGKTLRQLVFRRAAGFTLDGLTAPLLVFTPREEEGRLVWGMHAETERVGSLLQVVGPVSDPQTVKTAYASVAAAQKR